jgi:hypothetical protein
MSVIANQFGRQGSSRPVFQVRRLVGKLIPLFITGVVVVALVLGWLARDEEYLTPKTGLGYWLGIYGGTAMLLLLIYSMRKRSRSMRWLGAIPTWFRIHMLLGIAGPVLIIFHSNFKLGALNSNVALITMLIVAASGIVGRYLYGKIHMGLYGRKAEAQDVLAEAEALRQSLGHELEAANYIAEELNSFSKKLTENMPTGLVSSLWRGGVLSVQTRFISMRLHREAGRLVQIEGKARGWSRRERRKRLVHIDQIIRLYFGAVLKAAEFAFYERVFALWHVFHLPLIFLMVSAAVVHVWAVHQY